MKKLNENEKDFIIKNLDLDKNTKSLVLNGDSISDDLADYIRELCIEKNDYCSYDKDYNLTKDGKVLNLLIDKLFVD